MQPERELLITFDYELFLGERSGTAENCLIRPTDKLLQMLGRLRLTAVFFVDTSYLLRLWERHEAGCKKDQELIREQICRMAREGHYVFPHVHPHWLDARFDAGSGEWLLTDYSKYRFHAASEADRRRLFDGSVSLLKEILSDVPGHKPVIGYRAGGWSLQPFADFRSYFEQHGISSDFSVIPGFRNLSEAQYFDFSECPSHSVYRFNDDPCKSEVDGRFTEFTISTLRVSRLHRLTGRLWNKVLWKRGIRSMGNGRGVPTSREGAQNTGSMGSTLSETLSVELLTAARLPLYKTYLRNQPYVHLISHPKMVSVHNLEMFEKWLQYAFKNYKLKTDFCSFRVLN
jgi:hypothetical protein